MLTDTVTQLFPFVNPKVLLFPENMEISWSFRLNLQTLNNTIIITKELTFS